MKRGADLIIQSRFNLVNRQRKRSLEIFMHKLLLPLLFLLDGLEAQVTEKQAGKQNGDDEYRHDALPQPGLQHSTDHGQDFNSFIGKIVNPVEFIVRKPSEFVRNC